MCKNPTTTDETRHTLPLPCPLHVVHLPDNTHCHPGGPHGDRRVECVVGWCHTHHEPVVLGPTAQTQCSAANSEACCVAKVGVAQRPPHSRQWVLGEWLKQRLDAVGCPLVAVHYHLVMHMHRNCVSLSVPLHRHSLDDILWQ